jgi:hypothetical protein
MKCGCEPVQTGLYSVQTYICIYVYVCTMYIQLYEFINMYVLCTYIYRNSCTRMYIYVYSCTCIYHVHTCSQLYVNSWTCKYMSVPCSDTYVPICQFLSRWSGFQMDVRYQTFSISKVGSVYICKICRI